MSQKVNLFELNYDQAEQVAVESVLKSKWISMGAVTRLFEERFSNFIGTKHGVAMSNCTAALHTALKILDIGPADEVIVPSLTFIATVNVIRYVGATPVFADVTSFSDWTISVEDIEKKITEKTKAVIVMHYAGFGCDMDAIVRLARRRNLKLIEDASHAPGGSRKDLRLGVIGDCACYSFYSNKHISTAEGGMLLTNHSDIAERAKHIRSHGMNRLAYERQNNCMLYDITELGYNYRMDDIRASLGIAQLEKFPAEMKTRNRFASIYRFALSKESSVEIPFSDYQGVSPYYIFPVRLVSHRNHLILQKLQDKGIQTSIHYPPAHLFDTFKEDRLELPKTERLGTEIISLPMHSKLSENDIHYVCEELINSL